MRGVMWVRAVVCVLVLVELRGDQEGEVNDGAVEDEDGAVGAGGFALRKRNWAPSLSACTLSARGSKSGSSKSAANAASSIAALRASCRAAICSLQPAMRAEWSCYSAYVASARARVSSVLDSETLVALSKETKQFCSNFCALLVALDANFASTAESSWTPSLASKMACSSQVQKAWSGWCRAGRPNFSNT